MIYGYFGLNGCGKTLTMVRDLHGYDIVFCNFYFKGYKGQLVVSDFDTVRLFYKMQAVIQKLTPMNIVSKRIKICLAIDEAGLTFPARSFKSLSKEEAFLFAQHRKMGGMDFRYTAQNFIMVDRILRYNTAMSIYPNHFFNFFWSSSYEGFARKKEAFQYRSFYFRRSSFANLYNTMEIVETTKIYFSDSSSYPELVEFIKNLKIPSNLVSEGV
jgi:hypothetical protein